MIWLLGFWSLTGSKKKFNLIKSWKEIAKICQSRRNLQRNVSNMSIGRHNEWHAVNKRDRYRKKANQRKRRMSNWTTAYPIFLNPFRLERNSVDRSFARMRRSGITELWFYPVIVQICVLDWLSGWKRQVRWQDTLFFDWKFKPLPSYRCKSSLEQENT